MAKPTLDTRKHLCPECDMALTRAATLAICLRKMLVVTHSKLCHDGPPEACQFEPCKEAFRVLEKAQ